MSKHTYRRSPLALEKLGPWAVVYPPTRVVVPHVNQAVVPPVNRALVYLVNHLHRHLPRVGIPTTPRLHH
jgi:hypothetical protein